MSTTALNLAAAIACLGLSAALALPERSAPPPVARAVPTLIAGTAVVHEGSALGLRDATGHFVALDHYTRIASTSGVTDSVLLALSEPERIVAFTRHTLDTSPVAYRYSGKPTIVDISQVEALVALKPDLVLVNNLGTGDRIARLREAGLRVFDLGEMRGMRTLLPNIVTIATLLGRPDAGREVAARFEARMRGLARHIPARARPTAVYASIYGDSLYGASVGTNQHDVLTAAGLRDASASAYRDWPRYTSEMLIALDPEILVTQDGMHEALCKHAGLSQLRACGAGGRIVEVKGVLMDDPSLSMLDAAEAVHEGVYLAKRAAH